MELRPRTLPEHVKDFSPHARETTTDTFYKYLMHQDVVVTLDDGTQIITSAEKAHEIAQRPHPIDLPRHYSGE